MSEDTLLSLCREIVKVRHDSFCAIDFFSGCLGVFDRLELFLRRIDAELANPDSGHRCYDCGTTWSILDIVFGDELPELEEGSKP